METERCTAINTQRIAMNSFRIFSTVIIELSIAPQLGEEGGNAQLFWGFQAPAPIDVATHLTLSKTQ